MVGHSHEGSSSHPHIRSFEENRRALWIAIAVTVAIMIVEFVGGLIANSLALLSDAGHMLTDVLALVLSLVALQFTTRPASSTKTYGFYRMEILAALVNGASLLLISGYILYVAYQRLRTPEVVESHTMLIVATIGLAANAVAILAMMKSSGESLNIRGAYLHIVGDALSSVGVIIAGLMILFARWYIVDPIISVIICLVILRGAYTLVKDSVNILLESVPKDLELGEIQHALLAIPGVKDLHDMHLWTITSGIYAVSAHVLVDDVLMSRSGQILQEITKLLKEHYRIVHSTIQFECENCEEGMYCDANRSCVAVVRPIDH
jgi:cobalt-zinc-cadmium efflux system protein